MQKIVQIMSHEVPFRCNPFSLSAPDTVDQNASQMRPLQRRMPFDFPEIDQAISKMASSGYWRLAGITLLRLSFKSRPQKPARGFLR
jgi:hypothetical protein